MIQQPKIREQQFKALKELHHSLYEVYVCYNGEEYVGGLMYAALVDIGGFRGALHGMRNPKNSWRLSDSTYFGNGLVEIGEKDLKLAQTLIKAGSEHCKFLRQINVTLDLNLPRYVWSEFDTYHYNTKNSTSTMHKLLNEDDLKDWDETPLDKLLSTRGEITVENFFFAKEDEFEMYCRIDTLNKIRRQYIESNSAEEKRHLIRRAKQLLPECYLQMRTVTTNYAELRNIYLQRRHHLLDVEWTLVCEMIRQLPYAKELILYGIEE